MAHFIVATPGNFVPFQIDDSEFAKGAVRTCKGSLHVRPNSTMTISSDELGALKKRIPGVTIRSKVQSKEATRESPAKVVTQEIATTISAPKPRRGAKGDRGE